MGGADTRASAAPRKRRWNRRDRRESLAKGSAGSTPISCCPASWTVRNCGRRIKPYSRLLVSAERNFILDSAAGSSPTESKARRPQVSGLYLW